MAGLRIFGSVLMLVGVAGMPAAGAAELFSQLDFEQATAQAREREKLVFIDFYTTWCVPCKQLDATTFKDERVIEWMRARAIAIKVDAEKQRELAQRYSVTSYPTMVFVNGDGVEVGRVVGYMPAERFLTRAELAIAERSDGEDLARRAKAAGNDPFARREVAIEMVRQGQHAKALEHFLWCLDHGAEAQRNFRGARYTLVVPNIAELGERYAPANKALEARRDGAVEKLRNRVGSFDDVMLVISANRELREHERTLKLHDELRDANRLPEQFGQLLRAEVVGLLAKARRYEDVLSAVTDPEKTAQLAIGRYQRVTARQIMQRGAPEPIKLKMLEREAQRVCGDIYPYFEAAVALGKKDLSDKLAERVIKFADGKPWSFAMLIRHARRGGNEPLARTLFDVGKGVVGLEHEATLQEALDDPTITPPQASKAP